MKKLFVTIILILNLQLSFAQMIVNDPSMQLQQMLNYMSEMEQVIKQETMMAEELQMMYEEYETGVKQKKEQMEKIIKRIEKCVILYREIEGCYKSLENLRKNLFYSQYLSINEKYTIYSRAQMLCYDVIKRINDIDDLVKEAKEYKYTPEDQNSLEPKLDKTTAIVRQVRNRIKDMEQMSVDIVAHKVTSVERDLKLRKCFSVKLY